MSGDPLNHQNSPNASDWQFNNTSMSMGLPNTSIPIYHGIQMGSSSSSSYPTNPWNHPMNLQNPVGFSENNAAAMPIGKPIPVSSNKLDMGMFLPANTGILPPSLADFPADSSFIERAAKFSSFSAGNFSAMVNVNPFSPPESLSPYANSSKGLLKREVGKDGSMSVDTNSEIKRGETPEMASLSGDSSSKGISSKKRVKATQDMELDQAQESTQLSADMPTRENGESKEKVETSNKNGEGGGTDANKQDYIHVRARRGQATNSHSLAERVRRERISERMKYLQDLVPGCSKVTGKAVMLDEIINYVQSLQRQVEFLSMKLATVNPSIDLNIEGLLSKDMLHAHVGPPPVGFPPDLIHPQLLPSHQGLVQAGITNMVNQTDAFRRAMNAQFTALGGFKEPISQLPNPWETELHNMVQMNFSTNSPPDNQELNGKSQDGFPM